MAEKLQKVLARAGIGSRRHNEELIRAGRVKLNGIRARIGDRADLATDIVTVDGHTVVMKDHVYIKLYKPKGVLSSTEDELGKNRPTVRSLVEERGHLYPVGRLDKQSEGLIILTNDGQLAHRLTHPRYGHQKVYRVSLRGRPSRDNLRRWQDGLELDGQKTAPAKIEVESSQKDHTWLRVTMREGRKRQIRRIAALLGYEVTKLQRIQIGTIELGDLQPGQWQHLTEDEVDELRSSVRIIDSGNATRGIM